MSVLSGFVWGMSVLSGFVIVTAEAPAGVRTGPVGVPKFTLGWDALGWSADHLQQPDGPQADEPWRFTDDQARFLLWWYAIDREGRFVYRDAVLRRMKGWGKDPFAAALACIEFVGPCRFGGWKDGKPIVVDHPAAWIQSAAVSMEQTKNMMTLFPGMLTKATIAEYGIDMGKQIIYAYGGRRRIEAVTSSPKSLEGGRPTFTVKNETHHWLANNDGIDMADVVARNAAKSRDGSSRVLAITNAHAPGEGSDAERDYEAHRVGTPSLLYDSLEAPVVEDLEDGESLAEALRYARGDAEWLDIDVLVKTIQDPRTLVNTARRYYLNQLAASDDKAFDKDQWDSLAAPKTVDEGSLISLGFDGSMRRDHTVLTGTEIETGYQWIAGYWVPTELANGTFEIPIDEVMQTVDDVFKRYYVVRYYADPPYWQEQVSAWENLYNRPGEVVVAAFWTNRYKSMSQALLEYRHAMDTGKVRHDGDPRFSDAIGNAYRHPQHFVDDNGDKMWTIEKERPDSPLKIDAAMSGCLSWLARLDAIAAGLPEPIDDSWIMR